MEDTKTTNDAKQKISLIQNFLNCIYDFVWCENITNVTQEVRTERNGHISAQITIFFTPTKDNIHGNDSYDFYEHLTDENKQRLLQRVIEFLKNGE